MAEKIPSAEEGQIGFASRRSFLAKSALAASVGALPAAVLAKHANPDARPTSTNACLPNSHQIDLTASGSGRSYRLKIAVPLAPVPTQGHPLLIVLDGDAYFGALTDTTRNLSVIGGEIAAPIIVAIGYPDDDPTAWYFRRATDYTPTNPAKGDGPVQASDVGFGKFASFLDFLVEDALPTVANIAAVDAERISIFGHSFGGLAALHALFSRPDIFGGAAAISPSIYWGEEALLKATPDFLGEIEAGGLARSVFIAVGELEETFAPTAGAGAEAQVAQREAIRHARLITRGRQLISDLREPLKAHGGQARFMLVPDASHVSAPYAALPSALHLLLPQSATA